MTEKYTSNFENPDSYIMYNGRFKLFYTSKITHCKKKGENRELVLKKLFGIWQI